MFRDVLPQTLFPGFVGGDPNHQWEHLRFPLLNLGVEVPEIGIALFNHICGGLSSEVHFDEPAILIVVIVGDDKEVRFEIAEMPVRIPVAPPAGWLGVHLFKVNVVAVAGDAGHLYRALRHREGVV